MDRAGMTWRGALAPRPGEAEFQRTTLFRLVEVTRGGSEHIAKDFWSFMGSNPFSNTIEPIKIQFL